MSTVSVQQAGGAFQPVNIAVTISSERELVAFNKVLQSGIGVVLENGGDANLACDLANALSPLLPPPAP